MSPRPPTTFHNSLVPDFFFKLPSHQQVKFQVLILLFKVVLLPSLLLQLRLSLQSAAVPTTGVKAWHGGRDFPAAAKICCAQLMRNQNKNKSLLLFSEKSLNRKITHRALVFGIRFLQKFPASPKPTSLGSWKQLACGSYWTLHKFINPAYRTRLFLILKQLTEYLKEK